MATVTPFLCATCGTQFADAEIQPPACPICEDERQWVPEEGQLWTTLEELRAGGRNEVRREEELTGIGTTPEFAIGQRALLVPHGDRHLLWDCTPLLDEQAAGEIERRGGLSGIAISHPHFYSAMVEWARRFDCPIHLHAADASWVMRPDPAIRHWSGDTLELGDGLTLICAGGHFAGGTVLHWAGGAGGAGALLGGDIVHPAADRSFVTFMYSYPNLIPLSEAEVRSIEAALQPFAFEQLYGAWWGRVLRSGARAAVARSVERYARALRGEHGTIG
jgi:hypothetical protein